VPIKLKITKIEELSFSHRAFELLQKLSKLPASFDVTTNVLYNWNFETKMIGINLEFKYYFHDDSKDLGPFEGLVYGTRVNFIVDDLEKLFIVRSPDDFDIDHTLETLLVSISISTTRGMLAVRTMGTIFENHMIPILNPQDLLLSELLKKKKGSD